MDQQLSRGKLHVSQFFWESEEPEHVAAIELLKKEVPVTTSELKESMILEHDLGTYILTCRSRHFNEAKYGPDHVYAGTIKCTDGNLSLTIEP